MRVTVGDALRVRMRNGCRTSWKHCKIRPSMRFSVHVADTVCNESSTVYRRSPSLSLVSATSRHCISGQPSAVRPPCTASCANISLPYRKRANRFKRCAVCWQVSRCNTPGRLIRLIIPVTPVRRSSVETFPSYTVYKALLSV